MSALSKNLILAAAGLLLAVAPAQATIISVFGPNSTAGTAPAIIGAPSDALDDLVTNTGMQGFDEAQNVVTSMAYTTDSGSIPSGTRVNSHMIFLNSLGDTRISHGPVDWVFSHMILGIMSNSSGTLEAASTPELGNPATNYATVGSNLGAPFPNRGLESSDSYLLLNPFTLRVTMTVTEPGDWIRVVTKAPEPSTLLLLGLGLAALGVRRKRA